MDVDVVMSDLESRLLEWINGTGSVDELDRVRALAGDKLLPEPFLLEVDVLELAAKDHALAQAFFDNAEHFRRLVHSLLVAAGKLQQAERLWLRPTVVLAESCSCAEALDLLRCQPASTVTVHGVCSAATAIFQQRYSRSYECSGCGAESVVLEGEPLPECCGPTFARENQSRAATMQTQVIYISQEPSAGRAPGVGEPTFAIHLHDDLCGRTRPGDHLVILGVGRHVHALDTSSIMYGCRPTVQMDAISVDVLPAQGPAACHQLPMVRVQRPAASIAAGGLEGLVGALGCCFDTPCKPLLRLALLLSAAAAGVRFLELQSDATEGEDSEEDWQESSVQPSLRASRAQVNLLLLTAGPEPHLARLLQQAAAGLFQRSLAAGADPNQQLLPRLFTKYVEPSLQLPQLAMALGGQLAAANSGALLLSSLLGAKQGAALAGCARAGVVPLVPNMPELAVPLSPTIWFQALAQDLGKPSKTSSSSSTQQGEMVTRLAAKYGGQFLSLFDVVLDCNSEDAEDLDLWAEQLLSTTQRQQQAVQAAHSGVGHRVYQALAEVEHDALVALQAHLQRAVTLQHPCMTEGAMALLSGYFLMARVADELCQGALESMARVATACARLCHRPKVLDFPDAVVAVMFMEEQLVARGGYANHWCKWRDELARGTDLMVCLEGLHASLQDCLRAAYVEAGEE